MTDYNALRAQTLVSAQEEEAVTVNTRALVAFFLQILLVALEANLLLQIDKVLARYSSENTTYIFFFSKTTFNMLWHS